jgi:Family of unknown function (DUF5677)
MTSGDESRLMGVVASPLSLVDLAEQNATRLVNASNGYSAALESFLHALRQTPCHPCYLVVGVVCLNDFNDLLFDCLSGRGRSALRVARTLFEHLLNLYAFEDREYRDRFMCHSIVGNELVSRWSPVELFVNGKELKAIRHRAKKLRRDNRRELKEAIAEYGTGFYRHWHPSNARDRALTHDLEREYEFFRASSSAVHGAATAMDGSFWVIEGEPLVRVGPSVVACPSSLAAGVHLASRFVGELKRSIATPVDEIHAALDAIGESVPDFCRYTNGLEEHLFATDGLERPSLRPEHFELIDPSDGGAST